MERRQSYLNGACILVNRRFVRMVGPMREDYFLYCEEVEWFLRARARGVRLGFASAARVLHDAGSTTGSGRAFRQMPKTPVYLNARNRILVTKDTYSSALLFLVAPIAVVMLVLRFGRRGAWRQLGFAFAGWRAGLMGERGPPAWIRTGPD